MAGVKSAPSGTRRAVLAGITAGATVATGGCVRRLRSIAGWRSPGQVTLQIKTIPADEDPYALGIARAFEEWLEAAGIDADVILEAEEELYRSVLLNHDFDVFVAKTGRGYGTPDALYPLLHSKFTTSPGWQNPFGFGNFDVDDLLEIQRHAGGSERRQAVVDLQRTIARTQPFTLVCFPDAIRTGRNDRWGNWRQSDLGTPEGYLSLNRTRGNADGELRVATTDRRVTENLNPLAVEFRDRGTVTGLLYDSLARGTGEDAVEPWLAESWTVSTEGERPVATVRLRENLLWHDGEPLTAADVAFTYAFLSDTSLGNAEDPISSPRFQGRLELVADVTAVDARTVEFEFVESTRTVALSALTLPILPRHVWTDRTGPASFSGIEIGDGVTEALVTTNIPPIGSGPLRYVDNSPNESLVLERFEDHFLHRGTPTDLPADVADGAAYDRLSITMVGTDVTAVDVVASGELDATASEVGAATVPRIGREEALDLLVNRSNAFYFIGYNARRSPLSYPRFRNVLAHLVDKAALVEDVFEGYASPATSPLARTDWVPSDLRWDDGDPATPFYGTDGELDVGRARDAFREAGYRYEGGELQSQ